MQARQLKLRIPRFPTSACSRRLQQLPCLRCEGVYSGHGLHSGFNQLFSPHVKQMLLEFLQRSNSGEVHMYLPIFVLSALQVGIRVP